MVYYLKRADRSTTGILSTYRMILRVLLVILAAMVLILPVSAACGQNGKTCAAFCAYDAMSDEEVWGFTVTIFNSTWSTSYTTTSGTERCTNWIEVDRNREYYIRIKDTAGNYIPMLFRPYTYGTDAGPPYNFTQSSYDGFSFYLRPVISTQYYPHYVRFKVQDIFGTPCTNVELNPHPVVGKSSIYSELFNYEDTHKKYTQTDGTATYLMYAPLKYRIDFTGGSCGMGRTIYLHPELDEYLIISSTSTRWLDQTPYNIHEEIDVVVNTTKINTTHAGIGVHYYDNLTNTTSLIIYLNVSNESDWRNQVEVANYSIGGTSDVHHTFTVTNYTGTSFFIHIVAEHNIFGEIIRDYSVRFEGVLVDLGLPTDVYAYMSFGLIMFLGAAFGATSATQGSLVCCFAGWVFWGIGWLNVLGSTAVVALSFATMISITAIMVERGRREGHT